MCPCIHLEAIFWLMCHCLLAYLINKKLTQQSEKFARIC